MTQPKMRNPIRPLLEEAGIILLHTIGTNTSGRGGGDPWLEKYIFPNSLLPSLAQIAGAADGLFVIENVPNFGLHYDMPRMAWLAVLRRAWPALAGKYGERFQRMRKSNLQCGAGVIRSRTAQFRQIVMTRDGTGNPQPGCRSLLPGTAAANGIRHEDNPG